MLKQEKTEETNKLIKKMKGLYSRIANLYFMGKYDKALKYIEREELIIKPFQGDLPEEIKTLHTSWLQYKAMIYAFKGNIELSFKADNELLTVAQLYDHKRGISDGTYLLGQYHRLSGDLDTALEHVDRAIKLREENINNFLDFQMLTSQFLGATWTSLDKEDLILAKKYFKRIEKIKELKSRNIIVNQHYRLAKALLLKSSMRFRDRVKAEDLFREIIEDDSAMFTHKLAALNELCELLLVELRFSNYINIISEIKPLLENLIIMAQKSGMNYNLIEAYILQGKLALVMFDMENSRRYLTQARRMAEKYGYIGLANEIAGLHEAMMEKKDTWKQMEKINAPLSERMDLAQLDDHLKGRFRRLIMKMERATDTPPKKEVF